MLNMENTEKYRFLLII